MAPDNYVAPKVGFGWKADIVADQIVFPLANVGGPWITARALPS
jgi:hypothetical protein